MKSISSLLLVIILFTTAVSIYAQTEFKDYKGKFVEFQYPVEWQAVMKEGLDIEPKSGIPGSHVDKDKRISFDIAKAEGIKNAEAHFTIFVKDIDNKNLDQLVQEEITSYEESEDLWGWKEEILEVTDLNVSNEPAKKLVVYKERFDSKLLQVIVIHDNKRYSIVYLMKPADLFDDYIPTIEKMIESIKFTNGDVLKSPSENSDQDVSTKKDNVVNIASGDSNIQESTIPINVIDDIMRKHQQFAYTLGGPSSDIQITDDSQGYYQKFSKGDIYWHPQFGVHEVHGGISDKWGNLGNEKGALGYPISDEYDVAGGRQSDFEKGHISWSEENGEITVFMGKE